MAHHIVTSPLMMQVNYFLSFTVLCLLISYGESFLITIDAHAEECFYDRVTSGSKMNLMFEVAEGGFLDIDVKVMQKHGWYGKFQFITLK